MLDKLLISKRGGKRDDPNTTAASVDEGGGKSARDQVAPPSRAKRLRQSVTGTGEAFMFAGKPKGRPFDRTLESSSSSHSSAVSPPSPTPPTTAAPGASSTAPFQEGRGDTPRGDAACGVFRWKLVSCSDRQFMSFGQACMMRVEVHLQRV